MKEFLERACLPHASLSNVVGAHREALVKFLMSHGAADGGVENRMVTKGRPDPTGRANSRSGGSTSSFYTDEGEELSSSIDRSLSLLLPTSTSDTNRNEKLNFPFGIIGLLSMVSPYLSLVDSLAKTSGSSTIPSEQQRPPSATQCLQFLQAVALHEDAIYALWDTPTSREELGMLRRQPSKTTSPTIPSLPLESICVSAIFSVLPKVVQYLVSTQGYARQDIISSGIVTVMGRMAHFFGSSTRTTNMTSTTEFTTILTPAHSYFVQLCLLSGQYQYAITFASSRTAILLPQGGRTNSNSYNPTDATDTPRSPPLLIPLTVEHYLQYFYTLGNIYLVEDPRKYSSKALHMFTLCMTTPTTSSSSSSSSSTPTPFHQRQPSATTPISSDSTSSKASSAIHPLQIAARKKQLLVSCLVACSYTSMGGTTSPTTHDSYLYHLPPMPLRKVVPIQGRTDTTLDVQNRSVSNPVTTDIDSSRTSMEHDIPRTVPSGLGQQQSDPWESIPMAFSSQHPSCDSTNRMPSPTSWPWSLPLYTSTSVYNTFFLDPTVHYTYYQQQQSSTQATTADGSSTHMPQQQQQQQQQGSILKPILQELEQYNSLIAAYWFGDISMFRQISETFQDLFRYDETHDLIVRLEESFIFRFIYTLANVYEAIPISMLVDYITLLDPLITVHTLWKVLEKARECNADFTFAIDQQHGYVHFFFHTVEEQSASSSDTTAFVSEHIEALQSLAERIKEMDISLATSKKYQTMVRSKESATSTKQTTVASGTTTKPPTRSAAGGTISGSSAWI